MDFTYAIALCLGVASPVLMFAFLAFFGHRLGKPLSGWCAVLSVLVSLGLSVYVLLGWISPGHGATDLQEVFTFNWATVQVGSQPVDIDFKVKLDSLTVVMYFMVTLVSTCIFIFSVGYMSGHSDEIDGQCKYHRFFAYLCLFEFSMLGLVISSSLVFLFIFWELVGLCSYFLIGFYFDKKFASNAGIKAFITNKVGDFGFMLGLLLAFYYLRELDLDAAAAVFAEQFRTGTGIFAANVELPLLGWQISGGMVATLMGIGLFCGAIGKSAQFPLHVWLPDAMAGPTPVSALIHAATMVAAGVYLVARVFRLLTPDAQMVVAVIGCITLTITALIAIVQTDIKKVLAYSTLSQLGYMIFGLGVGAWIAALFHLITHAFFKAMLFLGSGQVIEGCHHEQDIRNMGGLRKKMPVTCWTFFVGVLAIAGFGIPGMHFGLGGYFSKDEVLAVAYERAFNWDQYTEGESNGAEHHASLFGGGEIILASANQAHGEEHAEDEHAVAGHGDEQGHGGHGSSAKAGIAATIKRLPKWMFVLPIIIAYVTPFYMMRVWWLTFMGKPRNEEVYHHAHEIPLMHIPLVILAAGTVFASYWVFRPEIADASVDAANAVAVVAVDGEAHHATDAALSLTHDEEHNPHSKLIGIVGFAWVIGMGLAALIYRNGLALGDAIKNAPGIRFIHMCLEQKLFFDHLYEGFLVPMVKTVFAAICRLFDTYIIDGIANLLAKLTVAIANFCGRILDLGCIDGVLHGLAAATSGAGRAVTEPQSKGRIRYYVFFGTAGASLVLVAIAIVTLIAG